MIKKLLVVIFFFLIASNLALAAERLPVSITPNQIISTDKDEIEFGDDLDFKVVKDVYKDDAVYIKKGAPVIAEVDYVSPNGWVADSAYVQIKKIKILDSKSTWLEVPCSLKILGRNCRNPKANIFYSGFHYLTVLVRGDEVFLSPNQQNFNVFILK